MLSPLQEGAAQNCFAQTGNVFMPLSYSSTATFEKPTEYYLLTDHNSKLKLEVFKQDVLSLTRVLFKTIEHQVKSFKYERP